MIPQLRELERSFTDELIVIGVHSAKYTAEGHDVHLQDAVRRLHVHHPVVNDHSMRIWNEYAVRAWPTLMFVGPDGKVIGKHEGEFDADAMRSAVRKMIDEAGTAGDLDYSPFELGAEPPPLTTYLAYPAAIYATDEYLYVADTGRHRIVVVDLDGSVLNVIGSGERGFVDGYGDTARFNAPHGLVLHDGRLYVADTENHAIRRVDIGSGEVTTIGGPGEIARSYGSGGSATGTALRSPWDVVAVDGKLFIAMAGNHQLWVLDPDGREIRRFAGTGHEGKRDDQVPRAWLAQPSGIGLYGDGLLFADAETSSVRTSATSAGGDVMTLVGKDLFDWGDVDGPVRNALLQHATGVAADPDSGLVYISDTYNNKIKVLDPGAGQITRFAGTGDPSHADGPPDIAAFSEPHGLSIRNGNLYVADTNNHAIRVVDLQTGGVSTLPVGG